MLICVGTFAVLVGALDRAGVGGATPTNSVTEGLSPVPVPTLQVPLLTAQSASPPPPTPGFSTGICVLRSTPASQQGGASPLPRGLPSWHPCTHPTPRLEGRPRTPSGIDSHKPRAHTEMS